MTPTEQDMELNKLVWLVRVHKNSHYGCEYRQDGMERASVKCRGCCHSSESVKRAEQNIINFVSSITAHTNAEIAKVLDRLESKAAYDPSGTSPLINPREIEAERAKLKEVK